MDLTKMLATIVCVCLFSCKKQGSPPSPDQPLSLVWQKPFGGSFVDDGKAIAQTSDGGYFLVGNSSSKDGDIADNGLVLLLLRTAE
ncbi:MAG: hypothetical protein JNL51_03005 [Chitinophagaceae bacterium]|nr:hypothetical protein [Chitinophagaceae bacterium]